MGDRWLVIQYGSMMMQYTADQTIEPLLSNLASCGQLAVRSLKLPTLVFLFPLLSRCFPVFGLLAVLDPRT